MKSLLIIVLAIVSTAPNAMAAPVQQPPGNTVGPNRTQYVLCVANVTAQAKSRAKDIAYYKKQGNKVMVAKLEKQEAKDRAGCLVQYGGK